MPKVNFSTIPDMNEYTPVPDGKYLCELAKIDVKSTKDGDEMWKLGWVILDGPYKGKFINDNLIFSANKHCQQRVKLFCSRIGLDTSGEMDLQPDQVKGRRAHVSTAIDEYDHTDETTGVVSKRKKNVVTFAGYDRVAGAQQNVYPNAPAAVANQVGGGGTSEEALPF